ncbi:MAG TPA: MAPEG family protein [Alphaproteobacteria bacterium]
MPLSITTFYAGLNGLILLILAFRVGRARARTKILIGTGGDAELERAIRAHANAAEYVPIVLILIGALELSGASHLLLHGLGIALTLGRVLHGWGLSHASGLSLGRQAGAMLTGIARAVASVAAIVAGFGVI